MGKDSVEKYNIYGELIIKPEVKKVKGERFNNYEKHRIHETKDQFFMECSYCYKKAKKYWEDHPQD